MNQKLANITDEKLEQRLTKLLKFQKVLNVLVIATIVLTVFTFLMEKELEFYLGSPISILILVLILKFVVYPTQIGALKTEINNRASINNQNNNQVNP